MAICSRKTVETPHLPTLKPIRRRPLHRKLLNKLEQDYFFAALRITPTESGRRHSTGTPPKDSIILELSTTEFIICRTYRTEKNHSWYPENRRWNIKIFNHNLDFIISLLHIITIQAQCHHCFRNYVSPNKRTDTYCGGGLIDAFSSQEFQTILDAISIAVISIYCLIQSRILCFSQVQG